MWQHPQSPNIFPKLITKSPPGCQGEMDCLPPETLANPWLIDLRREHGEWHTGLMHFFIAWINGSFMSILSWHYVIYYVICNKTAKLKTFLQKSLLPQSVRQQLPNLALATEANIAEKHMLHEYRYGSETGCHWTQKTATFALNHPDGAIILNHFHVVSPAPLDTISSHQLIQHFKQKSLASLAVSRWCRLRVPRRRFWHTSTLVAQEKRKTSF